MALMKCPECGKEISDQAKACIFCGYPIPKVKPFAPNNNVEQATVIADIEDQMNSAETPSHEAPASSQINEKQKKKIKNLQLMTF